MGSAGVNGFHDKAIATGPGVVLGRSGASFGHAHYCERDFWPHNTALYVTDFFGNHPRFVFYLLKAIDFSRHNSGGAQQSLNRNFIAPIPLAIPSHKEQEIIVDALSDSDALIESLESFIAKKRAIKQGAMQELLSGRRRLPEFDKPWERKTVGDVLSIMHGKSQRHVAVSDGPYPILATGGQIGTATSYIYDKPSVLVGRKGTIDRPQYVETPFWTVDTLFYSVMKGNNSAKFFFYRFCLIDWYAHNEASGVPSLNARTIEKIELDVPDSEEQIEIVRVLSDLDNEIDGMERRLSKARQIKQGMMQELLTGRIRLV